MKQQFKFIFIIFFILFFIPGYTLAGEVKFVQLTDVHVDTISKNKGKRMLEHSQYLLNDAVNQVNATKGIDFVIFTGDSINTPNPKFRQKFNEIVSRLNIPWYLTTGNHETNFLMQGKTYYSFIIDNFVFICMDGTIGTHKSANGKFSPKELKWLDQQLTIHKDKYAIIFQHFPLIEPFKSKDHSVINADEYLRVLDRHRNVAAVITGHYHYSKITKRNGVQHISSPALVQAPHNFRIITIYSTPEGVKFNFEYGQAKAPAVLH